MGIVRLGYHGSTETISEAAKNNEESISERLVLAIEGERENTSAPENKKQGKETKNKKSLRVFEFQDSYVLPMFYRYEHYMSISHMAIFVYMAM